MLIKIILQKVIQMNLASIFTMEQTKLLNQAGVTIINKDYSNIKWQEILDSTLENEPRYLTLSELINSFLA